MHGHEVHLRVRLKNERNSDNCLADKMIKQTLDSEFHFEYPCCKLSVVEDEIMDYTLTDSRFQMFKDALDSVHAARKNASDQVGFTEFFELDKNNDAFKKAMLDPLKRIGLYVTGMFANDCKLSRKAREPR